MDGHSWDELQLELSKGEGLLSITLYITLFRPGINMRPDQS